MRGPLVFILMLSACLLFGQTENVPSLRRCSPTFLTEWNTAVEVQYGLNVIDPENHRIGLQAAKKGGHIFDEAAALKLGFTNHDNWIPLRRDKQVLCGTFHKLNFYDSELLGTGIDYQNGEQDYGLYIIPDSASSFIIDDALPIVQKKYNRLFFAHGNQDFRERYPTFDSYLFRKTEWHKTSENPPQILSEAEIDVHSDFWSFRGFNVENNRCMFRDQKVCVYGPYVVERIHDHRPEIHPSEAFWSKLEDGRTGHVFLWEDNSHRFNDSLFRIRPNGESNIVLESTGLNWVGTPKKNTVRIPFESTNGFIDSYLITLGKGYSRNVHRPRPAPPVNATNTYFLQAEGQKVLEITEEFPQMYSITTDVCLDGNTVRGFADLHVEVGFRKIGGAGYLHLEILKNEKYVGKKRWLVADGTTGSPFLEKLKTAKYDEGDFSKFKYLDINADGQTDVLEVRSDDKWYVSYSATSPWQVIHEEPGSFGSIEKMYFFGDFDDKIPGDEVIRIKNGKVEILGQPEPVMNQDGTLENKRRFKIHSHSTIYLPDPLVLNLRLADVDGNGTLDLISRFQGKISASLNGGQTPWQTIVPNEPSTGSIQVMSAVRPGQKVPSAPPGGSTQPPAGSSTGSTGKVKLNHLLFVTTDKPITQYKVKPPKQPGSSSQSQGKGKLSAFRDNWGNGAMPSGKDKVARESSFHGSNQNRDINHLIVRAGGKLWATNYYLKEWIELDVSLNPSINFFKKDDNLTANRFIQGDFDGDFNTDFIFFDTDKKTIGFQTFGKESGTANLLLKKTYPLGMETIGVGDFNGDGKADVIEDGGPLKRKLLNYPPAQDLVVLEVDPASVQYVDGNISVGVSRFRQSSPSLDGSPQKVAMTEPRSTEISRPTNQKSVVIAGREVSYEMIHIQNSQEEPIGRFAIALHELIEDRLEESLEGQGSFNLEIFPLYGMVRSGEVEVLEDNFFTEGMNLALAKQDEAKAETFFGSLDNFRLKHNIEVSLVRGQVHTILEESEYAAHGLTIQHLDGILKNGIINFTNSKPGTTFSITIKSTLTDPYRITKNSKKTVILR